MNIYLSAASLAVAGIVAVPVFAESSKESMEHLLVTTTLHKSEAKTALPVTVLSGDELKQQIAATIGETLSLKPGLASASFGPAVGQPVIRGQQGARVTVLQNSTSSADASAISADHAVNVEPVLAESIEVLRGPATLLYGGGAIGGVVNVIDKRVPIIVPEQINGAVELRHGTINDENTGVMAINGGVGSVAFHFDALQRSTNDIEIPGYPVIDDEDEGKGVIENTASDLSSYTIGASYISDFGYIGFAINQLDNEYGLPAGAHEDHGHGDEEESVNIDIQQTRYDLRAEINDISRSLESLRWFFTLTDYEHDELEGAEVGTKWQRDAWENRLELVHQPINNWQGVIGLQLKASEMSAIGDESFIPETKTESYGLFLVEGYQHNDISYEVGARLDYDNVSPDAALAKEESFTSLSFSASLLWQIDQRWSLGVFAAQSERAPVLEELYSNVGNTVGDYVEHVATGAIEVGNENLDSETSNNLDVSLNFEVSAISGFVTVYYNDFSDYIFLENTGSQQDEITVFGYQQTDAEFYGIEFEAETLLGRVLAGDVQLAVFADHGRGKLQGQGDAPRMTPSRLGSKLTYSASAVSAYLSVVQVNDQKNPGLNESATEAYQRWDAGVDYKLVIADQLQTTLFITLKNINDEEIRNASSFLREVAPEAGRSIEFGLRASF